MTMKKMTTVLSVLGLLLGAACSASPTPTACGGSATCAATKPDAAKVRAHLQDHVQYPATRAQLVAACANTPEFSDGEKQWMSDHLPEGSYANAAEVEKALKL